MVDCLGLISPVDGLSGPGIGTIGWAHHPRLRRGDTHTDRDSAQSSTARLTARVSTGERASAPSQSVEAQGYLWTSLKSDNAAASDGRKESQECLVELPGSFHICHASRSWQRDQTRTGDFLDRNISDAVCIWYVALPEDD